MDKAALSKALKLANKHGKTGKTGKMQDALSHDGFKSFANQATGQGWMSVAENIAWKLAPTTTGLDLFNMLNDSSGHTKNMLNPKWSDAGVAVVKRGNNFYAVQIFGTK